MFLKDLRCLSAEMRAEGPLVDDAQVKRVLVVEGWSDEWFSDEPASDVDTANWLED